MYSFDFMKNRKYFNLLSSLLMVVSIFILVFKGLNYGVDFKGGTLIQIKYLDKQAPIETVRTILDKHSDFKSPTVTKFGSDYEITIKTIIVNSELSNNINVLIKDMLKDTGSFEIRRVDMVGAKVGSELREKGLLALSLSILGIFIYLFFRFEVIFSISSILPLFHDVLITLGIISLLEVEVNLDVLAAILTIIGYSLNDTIIIFDRIREYIVFSKEKVISKLINNSINSTLSRTLITSFTTLFVVFSLVIFGSDIIFPFAITLFIGIIIGTYSSIYVAASSLISFKFDILKYRTNLARMDEARREREKLRAMYENGVL